MFCGFWSSAGIPPRTTRCRGWTVGGRDTAAPWCCTAAVRLDRLHGQNLPCKLKSLVNKPFMPLVHRDHFLAELPADWSFHPPGLHVPSMARSRRLRSGTYARRFLRRSHGCERWQLPLFKHQGCKVQVCGTWRTQILSRRAAQAHACSEAQCEGLKDFN